MARKAIRKNLAYDDQKQLYYVCFNYGTDAEGHRDRRMRTFTDLAEAELALEQFQSGKVGRLPCDSSRLRLSEWLEYWLEEVIAPNRAYTTYYCYRSMIKKHINPAIGRIRLRQLEPWHIQRYYAEKMREGGLDSNSVHKHHILLHTALHLAFRQRILRENPVERVEAPREHPTRQFYYTPEQLRQLFRAVEGEWLEVVVKLGAYLGLRRGEICGLRWSDVDFDHYVIRIRISRTTAGNRVVEKTPKTANSIRTLGIAGLDDLTRLLHAIRARQLELAAEQPEYQDSGYVLTDETGLPRHPNQVTKAFHQFVQRNRLPDITVHGLRHTFASLANSARIPLVDIGKALGHKDVSITGRVYTHIFDQTHQEVLNTVAARIIAG